MSWINSAAQLLTRCLLAQSALAGLRGGNPAAPDLPSSLAIGNQTALGALDRLVPSGAVWTQPAVPPIDHYGRRRRTTRRTTRQPATASPATTPPVTTRRPPEICTTAEEGARQYFLLREQLRRCRIEHAGPTAIGQARAERERFPDGFRLIHAACARARVLATQPQDESIEEDDAAAEFHADLENFDRRVAAIDTFFQRIAAARSRLFRFIARNAPRQDQPALRAQTLARLDRQTDLARYGLAYGSMPAAIFHPDVGHIESQLRESIDARTRAAVADIERFYDPASVPLLGVREPAHYPNLGNMQKLAHDGVLSFTGPHALDDLLQNAPRAHRPANATSPRDWRYAPQARVDAGRQGPTRITQLRYELPRPDPRLPAARHASVELRHDAYRIEGGEWRPVPFPTDAAREEAKHRCVQALMEPVSRRAFRIMYGDRRYNPEGYVLTRWFWDLLRRFGPFQPHEHREDRDESRTAEPAATPLG